MQLRWFGLLAKSCPGYNWVKAQRETEKMDVGYFGASTGVAAGLHRRNDHQDVVRPWYPRGGRPDLACQLFPCPGADTVYCGRRRL